MGVMYSCGLGFNSQTPNDSALYLCFVTMAHCTKKILYPISPNAQNTANSVSIILIVNYQWFLLVAYKHSRHRNVVYVARNCRTAAAMQFSCPKLSR